MRSKKPISASDTLSQGSDRHSFLKNQQSCFGKRSFQPRMACLMHFHAPVMTVFSIVTEAFFRKNGLGGLGLETGSGKWGPGKYAGIPSGGTS